MRVDTLVGLQLLFILVFYAAVEEDCTGGLVIEVLADSIKVGADAVLLYGCQQSCLPKTLSKAFLKSMRAW